MLVAALFSCLGAWAQAGYMNVALTSGSIDSYALAEQPSVTFEEGKTLVIKCSEVETRYDIADVASYYFGADEADIANPIADKGFVFSFANNLVNVKGDVSNVAIYRVDGQTVRSAQAQDGAATINIADLSAGVYIVTINNKKSVKIIKK